MGNATISETLFEALCVSHRIDCARIPTGVRPSPDYEIVLGVQRVLVEVKQLDQNERDAEVNHTLDANLDTGGAVSPASRLREQIARGYRQLKEGVRDGQPTLLVIYNNSGSMNFIDSFTVTTAMFGSYGVRFGLTKTGKVHETGRGFMGNRRLTRNQCKHLSAIGVLKDALSGALRLEVYHNPFALVPVEPHLMALLATSQKRHPNPHDGAAVPWEPAQVEA